MDALQAPTHVYLCANYGWNESTNLACAVADVAAAAGISVRFVTTGTRTSGVHDTWDPYVSLLSRTEFAPRGSCVWFEPHRWGITGVRKLGLQNVAVVRDCGQLTEMCRLAQDGLFDDLVLCSPETLKPFVQFKRHHCVPAFCSVLGPYREPFRQADRAVWILDGGTIKRQGCCLVQVLGMLLDFNESLHVTLLCQGARGKEMARATDEVQQRHPGRLESCYGLSRQSRQEIYNRCGWGAVFACRSGGATYLLEGIRSGLFMAALDYGEAHEIIEATLGWPLPCEVSRAETGAYRVSIDTSRLFSTLNEHYRCLKVYEDGTDSAARGQREFVRKSLAERRQRFEFGWRSLWHLN